MVMATGIQRIRAERRHVHAAMPPQGEHPSMNVLQPPHFTGALDLMARYWARRLVDVADRVALCSDVPNIPYPYGGRSAREGLPAGSPARHAGPTASTDVSAWGRLSPYGCRCASPDRSPR